MGSGSCFYGLRLTSPARRSGRSARPAFYHSHGVTASAAGSFSGQYEVLAHRGGFPPRSLHFLPRQTATGIKI